jgi:TolB protein
MNVASKSTKQITRTTELEIGAHFLGNDRIITSRTEGADSDIVILSTDGVVQRRLTQPNRAIDVSPVPSPDGSEVVFCSDRSGGPQIYKMGIDGSNQRRISFVNSNFCTSPAYSPVGDKIAFVCRADGNFQMFVSDINGENVLQLTSSGSNEDPEFSPDGRYLTFSTTYFGGGYNIAIMRTDGTSIKQISKARGGDFEPAWGPLPQ